MARTCSEEEWELCGGCGDCDDGLCSFCGSEDCDGSGYNCDDGWYQTYNLPDHPSWEGVPC
jgi:hypothetical protein